MVKWTEAQEKAIYTSGSDILVAAAAGSGKTAVLVERIIQKVMSKADPIDIDELLVVTFTNAAAQEMRNRVGLVLEKALTEQPTSNHLKKQLSLLQRASISTLHSFCMDIVRQYAYLLDIDPSFRIANDMEADLIQQEVIDDLFEDWYGKEGDDQAHFFAVVDRFSSDRNDADVEALVLSLYTFSIQNPWPEQWLDELADTYTITEQWSEADFSWLNVMKDEVKRQFEAIQQEMRLAEQLARESDGPYHYLDALEADKAQLQQATSLVDCWDDLQVFMTQSTFVRLSGKRIECNKDKQEEVKRLRNSYRDRWNDMKSNWFSRNLTSHIEDMQELAPVIRQLTELVKQFKVLFTEKKKEKGIVDFSDLEHYCLQLLVDETSTRAKVIPSDVARQLQAQYKELLVDEYQDTNLVQETIITLISDQVGPGNIFMVGDVKQSIYGFRHADPSLFIDKYKRFENNGTSGQRIDLARNFRSREHVLTGANYIFRQILDEAVGDIAYDEQAELIYANKMYDQAPHDDPHPELLIIDRETDEDEADDVDYDIKNLEKAQIEARAYAQKIKSWIGGGTDIPLQVLDAEIDSQRDIQYRDIVILLRSMTWAPTIVDELKQQGIPVYAELSTGYFESIEIKVLLSLLKVIDNPRQDIPLAAVLRSPIVGLDEEALTQIRLENRQSHYYDALMAYAKSYTNETVTKVNRFLQQLDTFRLAAKQGALSELIWQIYRETGYFDFVGGMPGGRQRQANLRALYDRARTYETTSFRGLFRFLRFIEKMEERGDDLGAARALSEQEDVVRIMTIHKSKGLEFPVVIVGGMDRQFNVQDLNKKYLLDKTYGLASKYIDPVKRITYPTLFYHALQKVKLKEQLAEEIRVLYVALTRAKEKLVMVGNVASFQKKQAKWERLIHHPEWVLPAYYRAETKSYLDWVGPALIRHQNNTALQSEETVTDHIRQDIYTDISRWQVDVLHGRELIDMASTIHEETEHMQQHITEWEPLQNRDEKQQSIVSERLSYMYPHQQAVLSRAKQSVTEIKRQQEIRDAYSSDQFVQQYEPPIMKRPNFLQQDTSISAAEKGTALHTVMQHLPFEKQLLEDDIAHYIAQFIDKEIINEEVAETVDIQAIEQFYQTPIARQMMLYKDELYREVPFSLAIKSSALYEDWTGEVDEHVLIQGVIDCLIPHESGLILLDYKTDTIHGEMTDEKRNQLKERYDTQMKLYRHAIESIWKKPVQSTYLYFFAKNELIKVSR